MQELTTIEDILQFSKFDTWKKGTDGRYYITPPSSKPTTAVGRMSLATLEKMHPRIPAALEILGTWTAMQHYPVGEPFGIHKDVLSTVLYYTGRTVSLSANRGEKIVMSNITSMNPVSHDNEEVAVTGRILTVMNPNGDWNPTFVVEGMNDTFVVTTGELERKYPGSLEKWKLGEELGLDSASLMQNAFFDTTHPVVHSELVDITFE